jgi:hypothetical protein
MLAASLTFEHPVLGAIGLAVLLATIAVVAVRRPVVPRWTLILGCAGIILLVLAASGLKWSRADKRAVSVMVDLSPSTRGAAYRDPAVLQHRIQELLGDTPFEIHGFADTASPIDLSVKQLADLHTFRTQLPENDADAIVLFSDGRLTWPDALPPTYCVIDPSLEEVNDAAVTSLDPRGNIASVGVRNSSKAPRILHLRGVAEGDPAQVDPGAFILPRPILPGASEVAATFAPGDLWPENDALQAIPAPPPMTERWWIGAGPPGDGWRVIAPEKLPSEPAAFLAASAVVLDNVSADSLDTPQLTTLTQYVKDFGGGLVILGGDRAFAAGNYVGTQLDFLSPLASSPPEPTTHWLLLADASGSMNQPAGPAGRTRWDYAAEAMLAVLKQLPPADLVSIGSFADALRWWSTNRPMTETATMRLPPDNFQPRGPTHLDSALHAIVARDDSDLPLELLIATDAQASIDQPVELGAKLKSKKIRVHVLLIDDAGAVSGKDALQTIVAATGGTFVTERVPENWLAGMRRLFRAAQPPWVERAALTVNFVGELSTTPVTETPIWNRSWPKANVTRLAEAQVFESQVTMAAHWNFGTGNVAAVAFPARERAMEFVRLVERPPRDPRFTVSWDIGSSISVAVDAIENEAYLNGERFSVDFGIIGSAPHTVRQRGPGKYALTLSPPIVGNFARLQHGGKILDTVPLPRRYASEFDAVGNDRNALSRLARETGGAVVEPGDTQQLDVRWPRRDVSLISFPATVGAVFIAAGLIRWRIGS